MDVQRALESSQEAMRTQRYADAIALLEPFASLQDNRDVQRTLAFAYLSFGEHAKAIAPAARAAALMPNDADARYALGYCSAMTADYPNGIEQLDAALAVNPQHHAARAALIGALFEAGKEAKDLDPRRALDLLNRAHRLERENPNVTALLLEVLHFTRQKSRVIQLLEDLEPKHKARPELQAILKTIGQDPEYESLLRIHPDALSTTYTKKPTPNAGMMGCPHCGGSIRDTALHCPYCHQPVRLSLTNPIDLSVPWQTRAYYILSWILLGSGVLDIALAAFNVPGAYMNYFSGLISVLLAWGLLVQNEWVMMYAKFALWVRLIFVVLAAVVTISTGNILGFVLTVITGALMGFMIYLIDFEGG